MVDPLARGTNVFQRYCDRLDPARSGPHIAFSSRFFESARTAVLTYHRLDQLINWQCLGSSTASADPRLGPTEIDVGSLYASVFGLAGGAYNFAQSPAILVSSLAVLDNAGALLTESRRLGRTSPLLIAYRAVIECGVLTGLPEAPEFPDSVPEAVAKAVAGMWTDAHDCDRERGPSRPPGPGRRASWSWTTAR